MLAVLFTGCRLDVIASVEVGADGAASVAFELAADASLAAELERVGAPPASELVSAVAAIDGWDADEQRTDDGGLVVLLRHDASSPEELSRTLRDLAAGLAGDDPALVLDLDLEVADDGSARLDGTAGLRPPATAGAAIDGVPVGPAGDELAALVREAVTPALVVTLPGAVLTHDADHVEGRTVIWELPVGEPRPVSARSGPAAGTVAPDPWLVFALAGAAVVLVWLAVRRRRRARRGHARRELTRGG